MAILAKYSYHAEYKARLLNQWACQWNKSDVHRPMTIPLLAMLMVENTALAPDVTGDYGYAIGISQWHICYRGFDGHKFCSTNALARFHENYKWFTESTQAQFNFFSDHVRKMAENGYDADNIIYSWNSQEVGRRAKVKRFEEYVRLSIGS